MLLLVEIQCRYPEIVVLKAVDLWLFSMQVENYSIRYSI